jgi:hypothetical protein
VSVVAIGSGTPAMAADFVEQFSVPFPVYTDPERSSYRLAGMKRRLGLGLKTAGRAQRALQGGHRQGRTQGDPWQQGGVLLVDGEGRVSWQHVDDGAGDHASMEAVIVAVRALSSM